MGRRRQALQMALRQPKTPKANAQHQRRHPEVGPQLWDLPSHFAGWLPSFCNIHGGTAFARTAHPFSCSKRVTVESVRREEHNGA